MAATRSRRLLTWLGIAIGSCALLGAGCAVWWLRDPEPVFARRTGALTATRVGPAIRDGAMMEQEVRLTSATGLHVTLAVRRPLPDSGAPARRQLFLILGGQARGKGAVDLAGDTRGTVFASMDYPYDGDRFVRGLSVLLQVPAIRRSFYDSPPAITLALDYLLARPDVDSARVELVGASFGAFFATIAAARDARVRRLWLVHGGGDPLAMIDTGLVREIPFGPLRRPVVMFNARDDERIPRRSVEALWAAAREPKQQVWLEGRHVQGDRPDVLRALIDSVMARAIAPPRP